VREVRHLSPQNEDTMQLVVGARASHVLQKSVERPSGSEKRVTSTGRVESPLGTTERVNGSLTTEVAQARKRRGTPVAKGGVNHRSSAILIT
jgi:hypothetical protein